MDNDGVVYKEECSTCCPSRLQNQPLTEFEFRQKFLAYNATFLRGTKRLVSVNICSVEVNSAGIFFC